MQNTELALELCAKAAEILKSAGFEHVYTSMRSEACYYRHPMKKDLLRVAIHRAGRSESSCIPRGNGKLVSSLTFHPHNIGRAKSFKWAEKSIEQAVGKFF